MADEEGAASEAPSLTSASTLPDTLVNPTEERIPGTSSTRKRSVVPPLCARCKLLQISTERFIISTTDNDKSHQSLALRTAVNRPRQGNLVQLALRSGAGDIQLGSIGDIRNRAHLVNAANVADSSTACPLCTLIAEAITRYSGDHTFQENHNRLVKVRWELDGHEVTCATSDRPQVKNRTRRLRLSWDVGLSKWREAYLVFVAPTAPWRPNSDANSSWRKETHFLGRDIEAFKGKNSLIKSWIDLCKRNHGDVCKVKIGAAPDFAQLINDKYFGVIDVFDWQLKALPFDNHGKPARYVALSHVWGKKQPYTTVRKNIPTHLEHGGLESVFKKLPRAMRDAIDLVPKLGLRYIWIDSLCIVQDSLSSWRLNAQAMHMIYGNAYLTICAGDGLNSQAGLVAMHDDEETDDTRQLTRVCCPGVRLMVSRPPEMAIQDSVWNTRAWTFQERILSRRCLIFTEGRVYFQCRAAAMSEDTYTEHTGTGWSLHSMGAPLRNLREIERRSIWFYMTTVALYFERNLTQPRDILAAFQGVESVMVKVMRAPFCHGLPTSHFDFALLWQPTKAMKRRVPTKIQRQHECKQDDDGVCACEVVGDDFGGMEFPSWSWCGWVGGKIEYPTEPLEGCLLNVREWLRSKTWIQWHLRDGFGHLRPLWDRFQVEEDCSLEPRWRGYAGYNLEDDSEQDSDRDSNDDSDSTATPHGRRRNYWDDRQRDPPGVVPGDVEEHYEQSPGGYAGHAQRRKKKFAYLRRSSAERHRQRVIKPSFSPPPGKAKHERYLLVREKKKKEDNDSNREYMMNDGASSPGRRSPPTTRSPSRSSSNSARGRELVVRPMPFRYDPAEMILIEDNVTQDVYGRNLDPSNPAWGRNAFEFKSALPDNPFGVRMGEFTTKPSIKFPDMPILQFWTWHTSLQVLMASSDAETGLAQCHIGDLQGDWCGTITLDKEVITGRDGDVFDFIAISKAKAFTKDEQPEWNYYVPKERGDSEWDLYHVMLIQRVSEKLVYERLGVGKAFRGAFNEATWKEIKLG